MLACLPCRVADDEFLVLASDGVWDVMDNPGIVAFLRHEVRDAVVDTLATAHFEFARHSAPNGAVCYSYSVGHSNAALLCSTVLIVQGGMTCRAAQ